MCKLQITANVIDYTLHIAQVVHALITATRCWRGATAHNIIERLQRAQNNAAKVVCSTTCYNSQMPLLKQ